MTLAHCFIIKGKNFFHFKKLGKTLKSILLEIFLMELPWRALVISAPEQEKLNTYLVKH